MSVVRASASSNLASSNLAQTPQRLASQDSACHGVVMDKLELVLTQFDVAGLQPEPRLEPCPKVWQSFTIQAYQHCKIHAQITGNL
jgi:hypothetical protein